MRAFLCAVNKSVWDSDEIRWVRPEKPKAEWDKATLALANANSKAINAIFCGVSTDTFHRNSHVQNSKEAWKILRRLTKEPRRSRIQSYKFSLLGLRK